MMEFKISSLRYATKFDSSHLRFTVLLFPDMIYMFIYLYSHNLQGKAGEKNKFLLLISFLYTIR